MIGAEFHRRDGGLDAGIRREQDHERIGIEFLQLAEDGDAIEIRQLVVEQHQIDALLGVIERLGAILRFEDFIALGAQAFRERPADQLFVVDDKNRSVGHLA